MAETISDLYGRIDALRVEPEYESIEVFIEWAMEEGLAEVRWDEVRAIAFNAKRDHRAVRAELEAFGLRFVGREAPAREGRGYRANPHNRFSPENGWVSGGSGQDNIAGFVS